MTAECSSGAPTPRLKAPKPGSNLPFKTWNGDNPACFNSKNNKLQRKPEYKDQILPTDQSPEPGKGCRGAPSQTASGTGKSRRKQNEWAARGGLGFIGGDRLASASPNALRGECDLNECKARMGGGFPSTFSGASEDARGWGSSISHDGPGSGRGSCPGEQRQDPFV